MSVIPDSHRDLLERPLHAHLATVRLDGPPGDVQHRVIHVVKPASVSKQ
jgi:hypothetical protein